MHAHESTRTHTHNAHTHFRPKHKLQKTIWEKNICYMYVRQRVNIPGTKKKALANQ